MKSVFGKATEELFWDIIQKVETQLEGKPHYEVVSGTSDVQYYLDKKEDLGNLIINSDADQLESEEQAAIHEQGAELYDILLKFVYEPVTKVPRSR